MRILVTGAAGFIGSNLTRFLICDAGHEVIAVDKLTYAGNRRSLADLEKRGSFCFHRADICDDQAIDKIAKNERPDAVMHLAAESHVDRSIDGPGAFIETNIVGSYRLLSTFRKYYESLSGAARDRFRFLHVSTDEVFGSLGPNDPSFNESSPYDPHSPYSASKAASDHLVRAWHDTYGFPIVLTNCSNNYGPYQFPEKLIPVVILKAIRGEAIPVYGKGENIRDWLYVEDHARALERALVAGRIGRTYTIGGDNEIRNIDLVRMLCSILDRQRPPREFDLPFDNYASLITFVADRPGHDMRYSINASRIKTELGWAPTEGNKTGFEKTVNWYLSNQEWWESVLSGEYRLERQGLGESSTTGVAS